MKIAIGGDHAGFQYKETIKKHLVALGIEIIDFGPNNEDSCDYPDIAHPLALSVEKEECDLGIAICGSGNGISMALNKHQNIRAALCWNEELAELARLHNNANVISMPARFISIELAIKCVERFINTKFEGGRHQRRVDKIAVK
jgi:ribose 5-phosphate isomerase B